MQSSSCLVPASEIVVSDMIELDMGYGPAEELWTCLVLSREDRPGLFNDGPYVGFRVACAGDQFDTIDFKPEALITRLRPVGSEAK